MAANGVDYNRSALVLYATETGTSQDIARELDLFLTRLHFSTSVAELDSVSPADLSEHKLSLFVVSTTGQGEFTSDAKSFWKKLLKKKLSQGYLKDVSYGLVGLGDSSYPKFNWAARKLDKRLKQLGAIEIHELCEADEKSDDGTDGNFLSWLGPFREALLELYPLPVGLQPIPNDVRLPSKWVLAARQSSAESDVSQPMCKAYPQSRPDYDARPISQSFPAVLTSNNRVTPKDHWQDVRLLTLDTDVTLDYHPGEALAILPKNFSTDVDTLIQLMNWEEASDTAVEITPAGPTVGPRPLVDLGQSEVYSLRALLSGFLDITAIPRRSFFGEIAKYTEDEFQKVRLLEFADPQFLDEYYDYATRPRRSILEILQEFHSVKIPWQEAINVFPMLRPRQFSIASGGALKRVESGSSSGSGTRFELLVAIVRYRTVIKKTREGVCTRYLAALPLGSTLNVVLRREGRFHTTPVGLQSPHVLIGAGTGVAPLRSLIHEQQQSSRVARPTPSSPQRGNSPSTSPTTLLIYGGRNAHADYFFEREWAGLCLSNGGENDQPDISARRPIAAAPLAVITAFSRDQRRKIYVQDRIREHAAHIAQLLRRRRATVVVCGSTGPMPKAVRLALRDALVAGRSEDGPVYTGEDDDGEDGEEYDLLDEDAAETYLLRMEKEGRYKEETW